MTKYPRNHFIAVGPQCWGRGKTKSEAVNRAKESLSRVGKCDFKVYRCTKDTTIDMLGRFRLEVEAADPEFVETKTVYIK